MDNNREVNLGESDFKNICQLVFDNTGISLGTSKKELVKRRFTPRLKQLGLQSFSSYISYMKKNREKELTSFCTAITTNLTSFFRENHHYDFLKDTAIPAIQKRKGLNDRTLRVWSAGCSTGQEAYCLAITLKTAMRDFDRWDVKILATDLDEKCLNVARAGIYRKDGMEKVPTHSFDRYFQEPEEGSHDQYGPCLQASKELKDIVTFKKLNLIDPNWPMKGKFDVIFCRNVFIYFDKATQLEIISHYATHQSPGSYLCLGHSETIKSPSAAGYRLVGNTTYIRE